MKIAKNNCSLDSHDSPSSLKHQTSYDLLTIIQERPNKDSEIMNF